MGGGQEYLWSDGGGVVRRLGRGRVHHDPGPGGTAARRIVGGALVPATHGGLQLQATATRPVLRNLYARALAERVAVLYNRVLYKTDSLSLEEQFCNTLLEEHNNNNIKHVLYCLLLRFLSVKP